MSGFFGVASKEDCVLELFYGVDYHSHLGTRRGGRAVHGEDGFDRAIHNIENTPFRTKFDKDVGNMKGNIGIGCISDYEPQPLLFSSKIGSFSLAFVGKVNNYEELLEDLYSRSKTHFQEMTNGTVNVTELIAALICEKDSFAEGIRYVQDLVDGSLSMLLMTEEGIYAARDKMGRTPIVVGHKEGAYCLSFESHAYINLGFQDYKELGTRIKCNPSIKKQADRDALRNAVNTGVIDVIATDHAPHLLSEKEGGALKAMSGMPMIQFSLVSMLELAEKGIFSIETIVEKMCHAPAQIYGICNRGYIREGYQADLVLVSHGERWEVNTENILSKCGWSPLEGNSFRWKVEKTFANGHLIYSDGQVDDTYRGEELRFDY